MKLSTARKANLRSSRKRRRPGGPAFRNRNGRGGPGLSRRPGDFVPPAAESAPRGAARAGPPRARGLLPSGSEDRGQAEGEGCKSG